MLWRAWRWFWSLLPAGALPLRIRLGSALRNLLGLGMRYASGQGGETSLSAEARRAVAAQIAAMPVRPLISVVVPAYETPAALLRQAIASVQAQLYPHWELCVADDASPSPHVAQILAEAAAGDPRIRWVRRDANGHISRATNSALALASGDFVALMDHDDLLPEHALLAVAMEIVAHPDAALIYSDEDKVDSRNRRKDPYFKPDFDADLLLQQNLVSHLGVYRRDILLGIGGLRPGFEGSQDHDLALRFARACGPGRIRHIPQVLYHWRQAAEAGSFSQGALERCRAASNSAILEALAADGIEARLESPPLAPTNWRVVWPVPQPPPLATLILAGGGGADHLGAGAQALLRQTDYPAIELVIAHGDLGTAKTAAALRRLSQDTRVRLIEAPKPLAHTALRNYAIGQARGAILVLLDDDLEAQEAGWLREMVSLALRADIGAVGAKLLNPNRTLRHGGLVLDASQVAIPYLSGAYRLDPGHVGSLALVREVSAVSGACLALRREVFDAVGGLDDANLPGAYADIDLCLRIREAGRRILWTPFAELRHRRAAPPGQDAAGASDGDAVAARDYMRRRWGERLGQDPFRNPNLDVSGPLVELSKAPPCRLAAPG